MSRQTVFNYFPTKEQMLFDREEEIEAALLALVRDQPDGASLVAAFRRHTAGLNHPGEHLSGSTQARYLP